MERIILWRELVFIFNDAKKRFHGMSDLESRGVKEYWPSPDELPEKGKYIGDCDDFALMCRKLCRKKNLPSRLVHCVTDNGSHHLVLECQGYILDNLQDSPLHYKNLNYRWVKMSGYEPDEPWTAIEIF